MQVKVPEDWYLAAFSEVYPIIYAHRTVEAAAYEATVAAKMTKLHPCDRLVDLGCGYGRHLMVLEQMVNSGVGVDVSSDLLKIARERLNRNILLVQADMRNLPLGQEFDIVLCFFTSFGYFYEDRENQTALREMTRVLKPQGRLFLDYLNPRYVESSLVPMSSRTIGEYTVQEERWIEQNPKRINKKITLVSKGNVVHVHYESVRMYSREEMLYMLTTHEITVDQIYGDYTEVPYTDMAPRMILVGHKE